MSAMATGTLTEPDGNFSQEAIEFYTARAKGGTGLIITGSTRVDTTIEYSAGLPLFYVVNSPAYMTRLKELAESLHGFGAKIAIQLTSGLGRYLGVDALRKYGAIAPSAVPCFWDPRITARSMTTGEIKKLVSAFDNSAEILRAAGVDAIEINAHNGYLADQFQTALWNKRTDEYGGDLEGRLKFAMEVIEAIRRGAGSDFPIIYRFGLTHYLDGGRTIEEGLEIAKRLADRGVDAFHIDAGCFETRYWGSPPTTQPQGCMVDLAYKVKQVVNIPVIAVGKLGHPDLAEQVLQQKKADFIALGRPLLADPEWPNKVRQGQTEDICPCIGCYDGCINRVFQGLYISCTVNPATGREKEFAIRPAKEKKSVLVIGGGPGGMEAASIAARRGHIVSLLEKSGRLGGNLILAASPVFKRDYQALIAYMIRRLEKQGVVTKLGTEATAEMVRGLSPDVVIFAVGSQPLVPSIPGATLSKAVQASDLLNGRTDVTGRVVVMGANVVGCEVALHLGLKGEDVTIVEMLDEIGRDMCAPNRLHILHLLSECNVKVLTNTRIVEITAEGAVVADPQGKRSVVPAESVVIAIGYASERQLLEDLGPVAPEVYAIGDCVTPRKAMSAIWEGFHLSRDL